MLYNCYTEQTLPGLNLWDIEKLRKDAFPQEESKVEQTVIVEDTIEKKTLNLGMNAEMKLSLLSGLLTAGGSAGYMYMYDRMTSKQQAQATLKYSCSTRYETINNVKAHLDKNTYETACKNNFFEATHVVTEVEYGCDAFFVFTRSMDKNETEHEVAAEMKAVLDCIPKIGGGAGISASFKCGFEKERESYCCTYYGDFRLDPNPTTFDEAVNAYKRLSNIDSVSKPRKARLAPLTDIIKYYGFSHPECMPKLCLIDVDLISEVQDLLEKIHDNEIKLADLSKHETCKSFQCLKQQIEELIKCSTAHTRKLKNCISKLIPEIRCSKAEEKDLEKAIQGIRHYCSTDRVVVVESKILEFSYYLKKINELYNIKIVGKAQLTEESLAAHYVVCFVFNSPISITTDIFDCTSTAYLRDQFEQYFDFATANLNGRSGSTSFIVTEQNTIHEGPITVLYENGRPSVFIPPSEPTLFNVCLVPLAS